jgi:CBS domain-containing protein
MIRLRDIMTKEVFTVSPGLSIREAAEIFASRHIGGAPVLDRDDRVIGVITAADILEFASAMSGEPPELGDNLERNEFDRHTVEEAMTRAPLRTLGPDATAREAATIMQQAGIHRIPVMEGDRLLGVVSTLDLAKAIADGRLATNTFVFPRATRTTI